MKTFRHKKLQLVFVVSIIKMFLTKKFTSMVQISKSSMQHSEQNLSYVHNRVSYSQILFNLFRIKIYVNEKQTNMMNGF